MRRRSLTILVCCVLLVEQIVATEGICQNRKQADCLFIPESGSYRKGRSSDMAGKLFACDFEVFGIVQGRCDMTILNIVLCKMILIRYIRFFCITGVFFRKVRA